MSGCRQTSSDQAGGPAEGDEDDEDEEGERDAWLLRIEAASLKAMDTLKLLQQEVQLLVRTRGHTGGPPSLIAPLVVSSRRLFSPFVRSPFPCIRGRAWCPGARHDSLQRASSQANGASRGCSDSRAPQQTQERRPTVISSGPLDSSRPPPPRGPGIETYHIPKGVDVHIPKGLAAATAEKLLGGDRARFQEGVFKPSYILPTMSVEEWGALVTRVQRQLFPRLQCSSSLLCGAEC